MRCAIALTLLLVLLAGAPVVSGQVFLEPGGHEVELQPGKTAFANFTLKNALNKSLAGFARLDGGLAEGASVAPSEFRLPAGATRNVTVTLPANALQEGAHQGTLRVLLVDQESGQTQRLHGNITALVPAPLLLFGVWETPLPAPLDGAWGLFLVETAAWIVGAYVVMRLSAAGTTLALARVPRWVRDQVVQPLRTPIFLLVFASGLRWAWRFFPAEGWVAVVQGTLDVVLALAGAFLIYRLIDAALVYLSKQVAPRTETKWDDILIPVSRKIAITGLVGFAFFYAMSIVGLDLGFLVAGGLIIGLVLSNSLGPTLQNLFSGMFILIDRPFTEGDDIRLDTGEVCNVRKIGLRSTRLYFYRNHEYIIAPNKDLENSRVVNLNFPDRRYKMHVQVGVAYGSPLDRVRALLLEAADEHDEVFIDEEFRSGVFFDDFGESGLLFRLVVFVNEVAERFRISSELRDIIDRKFKENDITIPFPQRTLWNHNVERRAVGPGTYEGAEAPGGQPSEPGATDPPGE